MLYLVIRGQSSNAEVWFKHADGSAIPPLSSVQYQVFDYNNSSIISGSATQDIGDPSHWTTTFVIPTTAPVGQAGNKYRIAWTLVDTANQFYSQTEYFLVVAEGEPPPRDLNVVMLENRPFVDTVAFNGIPTSLTVAVHDVKDNVLLGQSDVDITAPRTIGDLFYFDFSSGTSIPDLRVGNYGASPAFALWEYSLPGLPNQIEIHPIYILNSLMFRWINDVRVALDKAHNQDIDPTLAFTDAELAHYVLSGLQRINITEPQNTNFTIMNLPDSFTYLLSKAAQYEALFAWHLAEGLKAFEFQGLSTQLSVDRTQYIQQAMDNVNQWLEEHIRKAKKIWARSGSGSRFGTGVLSISLHKGTNIPYNLPSSFLGNYRWLR